MVGLVDDWIDGWTVGRRESIYPSIQQSSHPVIRQFEHFMKMELRKSFQFEAAHLLPRLPKAHKCRRLHGHSFKVEIVVAGECDPKLGWLMDYAEISKAFKPLWEKLDHNYLNKIPGLENPTSEVVASWIWRKLKPKLPLLTEVVVAETCTAQAVFRG